MTRVGQVDAPPTTLPVRRFRRVAGVHVDVFQTPPDARTQQAVFAWRHTHVSVASHGLPLDEAWFARLVVVDAGHLAGLRMACAIAPQVADTETQQVV